MSVLANISDFLYFLFQLIMRFFRTAASNYPLTEEEFDSEEEVERNEYLSHLYQSVLRNPLILPKVLSFLPIKSLKRARLVCSQWVEEASPFFSEKITVTPLSKEESNFLHNYGIQHVLVVNKDNVKEDFILHHIENCSHLIKELRLKITILSAEDVLLFQKILSLLSSTTVLLLDLKIGSEASLSFDKLPLLCMGIQKLRIRILAKCGGEERVEISQSLIGKILAIFPSVSFLELLSSPKREKVPYPANWRSLILSAASRTLPHVNSVKTTLSPFDDLSSTLITFNALKSLHLYVKYEGKRQIEIVEEIIKAQSDTLESLNIFWSPGKWASKSKEKVSLPHFPHLKTLEFATSTAQKNGEIEFEVDILGLGQIFNKGPEYYSLTFPLLETLVFLPSLSFCSPKCSIWGQVFPKRPRLVFPQIKNLVLSIQGECNNKIVTRLQQLFPLLSSFTHLIGERHGIRQCSHQTMVTSQPLRKEPQRKKKEVLTRHLLSRKEAFAYSPVLTELVTSRIQYARKTGDSSWL